jgi:hypothetical protein
LAALRVRREQRDAVAGEPVAASAAPEGLVGDHDLSRCAGEEIGERLELVLVGRGDRVAERDAVDVGQQHQPHPQM